MDHPELTPREMLYEICRILGVWWGRKVTPDEIGLRITMDQRYPLFQAFIQNFEGEAGGTPTQGIDNLLNEIEREQSERQGSGGSRNDSDARA